VVVGTQEETTVASSNREIVAPSDLVIPVVIVVLLGRINSI
jgi:hypothetical protein